MTGAGQDPLVRGWCPGALRPMPGGDGLIVRIRSGGTVALGLAQQIADWSCRWGNGQIDLTNRANLQLRGLSERHLRALRDALAGHGLLDASAAAEAVRNVIASPLAGLDPAAVLDVRPIARQLEQGLARDPSLHALPGKFGFAIDDGGSLALDDVAADVRFVAHVGPGGPGFAVQLGGSAAAFGFCCAAEVVDVAITLSRVFLRRRTGREPRIRRMRDLVAADGAAAIGEEAGLSQVRSPAARAPIFPASIPGPHQLGSAAYAGVGLPFGRIVAEDFAALAATAAANHAGALRLTPWRSILVPVPSLRRARGILDALPAGSFIADAADARCRVAACPGAPSCERATTAVRDDAVRLAAAIIGAPGVGIAVHVSGCEKGCAHPHAGPVTLVGCDGRYDVVLDGDARGAADARGLTLDQAAEQVRLIMANRSVAA